MSRKKPQISIDDDVHFSLKKYCALKRKKLSHVATIVLRDFLTTEHKEIRSKGEMIIEKPDIKTIVEVLEQEQPMRSPRRSLQDLQIINKGDRCIVVKK